MTTLNVTTAYNVYNVTEQLKNTAKYVIIDLTEFIHSIISNRLMNISENEDCCVIIVDQVTAMDYAQAKILTNQIINDIHLILHYYYYYLVLNS